MIVVIFNVKHNYYNNSNKNLIKREHMIHSILCNLFINFNSSLTNISSIQNLDITDDSSFLKSKFT